MAIEYYESIDDQKYIGYQERQNELLSKPDIIKKMNELVSKALIVPKKRKATKPSKESKEKRIETKKKTAVIKEGRKKISSHE